MFLLAKSPEAWDLLKMVKAWRFRYNLQTLMTHIDSHYLFLKVIIIIRKFCMGGLAKIGRCDAVWTVRSMVFSVVIERHLDKMKNNLR